MEAGAVIKFLWNWYEPLRHITNKVGMVVLCPPDSLRRAFTSSPVPRPSQKTEQRHMHTHSQDRTSCHLGPRQPKVQAYFSIQTGQEVACPYIGEVSDQCFWHGEHCTFSRDPERREK
jgi:hypothetical protein